MTARLLWEGHVFVGKVCRQDWSGGCSVRVSRQEIDGSCGEG